MKESVEQEMIFNWIRAMTYKYPNLSGAFAVPNGGYRNFLEAKAMKRQGVKAGVSDIFIPGIVKIIDNSNDSLTTVKIYAGMFLELKVGNNKMTSAQKEFLDIVNRLGYYGICCVGSCSAILKIEEYCKLVNNS